MKSSDNKEKENTIVFDLETKELIPEKTSGQERLNAIKELNISVICAYSYLDNKYSYFEENNIHEFIKLLNTASKIVGFILHRFDYKVLEKHGLPSNLRNKTIDIFYILWKETGKWYSLDEVTRENLGRGKLFKGKNLPSLKGASLYEGCKADVEITKELYELWIKGELKHDNHNRFMVRPIYYDIPIHACPKCGSRILEKCEELEGGLIDDGLTEGVFAEYMAGTWGTVYCLHCGGSFDYD